MLSFRSEADVDAWCGRRTIARGAMMELDVMWALSRVWYAGRADADWRGRGADEAQAVVDSVGLEGKFWNFSGTGQVSV